MRKALIAIAALGYVAAAGVAWAQLAHEDQSMNQTGPASPGGGRSSHSKQPEHPPPPPLRRCPDLAVASYTFVTAIPGQPALGADEMALQFDVHNGGNAPYQTGTADDQSLALEYSSPSGTHQIAAVALPTTPTNAVSSDVITLAQGQSWRGYLRATVPAAVRRWPLKLRLNYASDGFHRPVNDCDTDNNAIDLAR
jgi:hypothetical protein